MAHEQRRHPAPHGAPCSPTVVPRDRRYSGLDALAAFLDEEDDDFGGFVRGGYFVVSEAARLSVASPGRA